MNCYITWRANNWDYVSKVEQEFVDLLKGYGLVFVHQAKVNKFWVDLLFEKQKVIVEFDGDYWHSTPKAKRNDKYRDKVLTSLGYRVVRIPEYLFRSDPNVAVGMVELSLA